MRLDAGVKLDGLLKKYPFLLEFLADVSPKYAKLKNPIMRKTIGKLATLGQVASLGDLSLEKLLSAIAGEVKRVTGEEVLAETGAAPEKEAFMDREARLEVLKDIIRDLHRGEDIETLRKRFSELIKDLGPTEIPKMEQKLIEEGMPEEEVKRLCDVHVHVFKETLEGRTTPDSIPGHPLHTLAAENRALEAILASLEKHLEELKKSLPGAFPEIIRENIKSTLRNLSEIEKHYVKKENQLFPLLEDKNVSGPSKVMWAIHDDVRAHLKELNTYVAEGKGGETLSMGRQVVTEIRDMIYKEEKILFPMTLETLDERDWARVKRGEEAVGYAWIVPGSDWKPSRSFTEAELTMPDYDRTERKLVLDTGELTLEQVNLMLKHLPVDMSFVDENDTIIYYSDAADRIFPRSPAVIGRKVQNCHPPASVPIVKKILGAFKAGTRNSAEFWIQSRDKFIHIRYFAVRDKDGAYRGCLEVSQDVTAVRKMEGQKRLLDWD